MKKIFILVALVLAVSVTAYAQKGPHGQGHGGNGMMGGDNCTPCAMMNGDNNSMPCGAGYHGEGRGHKGMGGKGYHNADNKTMPVITLAEAKTKVADYVKANFKGYTVKEVKEFTTKRGYKAFTADAKDASGNEFVFHVTPWGDVKGPMPVKR